MPPSCLDDELNEEVSRIAMLATGDDLIAGGQDGGAVSLVGDDEGWCEVLTWPQVRDERHSSLTCGQVLKVALQSPRHSPDMIARVVMTKAERRAEGESLLGKRPELPRLGVPKRRCLSHADLELHRPCATTEIWPWIRRVLMPPCCEDDGEQDEATESASASSPT